jgi:hypothetical protein
MIKTLALLAVASGGVILNASYYDSTDCTGPAAVWIASETGKCIDQGGKLGAPASTIYNGTSCTSGGEITIFEGPICAGAVTDVVDFPSDCKNWGKCEPDTGSKYHHSKKWTCTNDSGENVSV